MICRQVRDVILSLFKWFFPSWFAKKYKRFFVILLLQKSVFIVLSHIAFRRGVVSVSVSVYVVIAAHSFCVVILGRSGILSCFFFCGGYYILLISLSTIMDIHIVIFHINPYLCRNEALICRKSVPDGDGGILILQFVARMFRHGDECRHVQVLTCLMAVI